MSLINRLKTFLEGGRLDVADRYELVRTAYSGTMSQFHMARDRQSGQLVGLKILDPEKLAAFEARFRGLDKPSEGEIASSIDHPRIVKTFRYGLTTDGHQFVLMEYLDGPGLNNLINNSSPILDGNRLTLMRQMAEAVNAVHQAGFIHRDICPRNFICAPDGTSLKLIDFGLSVPATPEFTQPGNRTGTPTYMAPEIARRRATDHRVDLFSLGVSLFQLCTGELPWASSDITGRVAMLHDTVAPTDIRQVLPNVHPDLAALIHQSMSIHPTDRPETAERVVRELEAIPALTVGSSEPKDSKQTSRKPS